MPTRRTFLQVAAMAPAAIIALKNRKAEAKPITPEERRARIERAQKLMTEQKINSICLAGGTSLDYFSGVRWGNSERMFIMVIPMRGELRGLKKSAPANRLRWGMAAHTRRFSHGRKMRAHTSSPRCR